ncbi:MAG: preprotein translocase subunit SecA [Gammaproteobacteria bacterium]|nr:MAG: preprotein translocase subunit SecA [Gammaproteobacteria bacterium]
MLGKIARKLVGSRNDRYIKSLQKDIAAINALEPAMQALSDEQLRAKTDEFKSRLADGETLDDLLCEAFAVCREAAVRTLGLRHYDVQLIGGITLHQGKIAEMRTGEGKTLVATLPVYLNALTGEGVHVVTVNDYLATRDAEQLGVLYGFLGLTTGVCIGEMAMEDKIAAYQCDVLYGTNNEFGFDYLRTNMALDVESRLQRGLNFAIIDEVDSILIDEARTPLIISGAVDQDNTIYTHLNKIVPQLVQQVGEDGPGDFTVDEKDKNVGLTDEGHDKVEQLLGEAGLLAEGESIYNPANIGLFHHLNACLRAHHLYHKDVEYIVSDEGEIVIVDEFTGRTMPGRRWSEGLHQAIEAKEGVEIQDENQTMASITFQNFFRMYDKLAGMTGTADTEAFEFQQIYNLETIVIPTNLPIQRRDEADAIFLNQKGKFDAVVQDIIDCSERGQPVLVGTTSIEVSEFIGRQLEETGIKYELLNAKQHEREAHIIENAGRKGAVTIATNMAGRGTDIVLGGSLDARLRDLGEGADDAQVAEVKQAWQADHDEVISVGGLRIVGTERHESRRIDNQLRGRAGRQGDPGSSKFYLSLEDNLMRIFASEGMARMMQKLGMKEDEAIEHRMVSNAIENAQRKVESHNFDARKQLIEYDDVANEQRKVIYGQRNEIMESDNIGYMIESMREGAVDVAVNNYIPPEAMLSEWDKEGLQNAVLANTGYELDIDALIADNPQLTAEDIKDHLTSALDAAYQAKMADIDDAWRMNFERVISLQILDAKWREHLKAMDYLRQGIGLRASRAQKDPRQEYKREAFHMFEHLLDDIAEEATGFFSQVQFQEQPVAIDTLQKNARVEQTEGVRDHVDALHAENAYSEFEDTSDYPDDLFVGVHRNAPCPCNSGKKFKHCHGKLS